MGLKSIHSPSKVTKFSSFLVFFDPTFWTSAKVLYSTLPRATVASPQQPKFSQLGEDAWVTNTGPSIVGT
jgi:hypothetical protein